MVLGSMPSLGFLEIEPIRNNAIVNTILTSIAIFGACPSLMVIRLNLEGGAPSCHPLVQALQAQEHQNVESELWDFM